MSQNKGSKIFYEAFPYYDRTGMQEFLEQKASEGWRLVRKVFAGEWEFEPMEPKKLHYAVEYLSQFSNEDEFLVSENIKEYLEMCSATGWQFVCAYKNMVFFLNEEENPVPLETDPEEELDVIHKAVLKRSLPRMIITAVISVAVIIGLLFSDSLSKIYVITVGALTLLSLWFSSDFLRYLRWRKKARAAASLGKFSRTDIPDKLISCLSVALVLTCFVITVAELIMVKDWKTLEDIAALALFIVLYHGYSGYKKKAVSTRKKRMLNAGFVLICIALVLLLAFADSFIS